MKTKHPKSLYPLILTELFERFSYYSMLFLIVLYMSTSLSEGGLGLAKAEALRMSGFFAMLSCILPLLGSSFVERSLKHHRAVILGCVLTTLGHVSIFASQLGIIYFYLGWSLVAVGGALFRPSLAVLLGSLYKKQDIRRGAAYNLYYAAVNVGGLLAGISGGLIAARYGYHYALGSAAVLMLFSMIAFLSRYRSILADIAQASKDTQSEESPRSLGSNDSTSSGLLPFVLLLFCCIVLGLWFISYSLALSGTLSLYIESYTDRVILGYEVPTTFFLSLNALIIFLGVPIVNVLSRNIKNSDEAAHTFARVGYGMIFLVVATCYLLFLASKINNVDAQTILQSFEVALFITLFSISELLVSPTMIAVTNIIAPSRHKGLFISVLFASLGIAGLAAGELGALALQAPFKIFGAVFLLNLLMTILYYILKPGVVRSTNKI